MVIYIVIIHDVHANDNLDKEKYKAWIRKKGQLFIIYVWYSFRIMWNGFSWRNDLLI